MDRTREEAVERAVGLMRSNLSERITIDDMASEAMFSKFYFTRIFQTVTGSTPARFLSALRLAEAKRLLVSTSFTVADISYQVGYNSPGTFSSRFTECVGVSPITYRKTRGRIPRQSSREGQLNGAYARRVSVRGNVRPVPGGPAGPTFVGLFPDAIPQGPPISCAYLPMPGEYKLDDVPPGEWHAVALTFGCPMTEVTPTGVYESSRAMVASQELTIPHGTLAVAADLHLRPMRPVDPPIVLGNFDVSVSQLEPLVS